MEVKVLLDVQRDRMISEVILFCSDHITIDASTEGADMYACIDETITKIMRRMRKHKTRLMKIRPHHQETIRKLDETVYDDSVLDYPEDSKEDPEPMLIHRESYNLKKLYKEEAIMELELSGQAFRAVPQRGATFSRSCTEGRTGITPLLSSALLYRSEAAGRIRTFSVPCGTGRDSL